MAVKVKEGIDYRILPDNYRLEFYKHNKPLKIERRNINGVITSTPIYRCLYCGKLITNAEMEVDHIIPKTRYLAGIAWNPNKAWNLGPSCKTCNIQKSNYVDERTIIGFQNKVLGKYGLKRKLNEKLNKNVELSKDSNYTSGDSEKVKKAIPFLLFFVYLSTIIVPLVKVLFWTLDLTGRYLYRIAKVLFLILKRLKKYLFRFIKWYFKRALSYLHKPKRLAADAFIVIIAGFILLNVATILGLPIAVPTLIITTASYIEAGIQVLMRLFK